MERLFDARDILSCPPQLAYDDHSIFRIAGGGVYLFLGCRNTKWTDKGLESIDAVRTNETS